MIQSSEFELTGMIQRWFAGDRTEEQRLFEQIYPIIRGIAGKQHRGQGNLTMQATELANEAFISIMRQSNMNWGTREQFFALIATVVRRVLIDYLRERSAQKRGGAVQKLALHLLPESEISTPVEMELDWLKLDCALNELQKSDPESSRLIELRYFLGMSMQEIAAALSTSVSSLERQWRFARAWLQRRMLLPG